MLTSLGLLFLAVLATAGIVAGGWWAMNEGFRQGDDPSDVEVGLDPAEGLMSLHMVNPAGAVAAWQSGARIRRHRFVLSGEDGLFRL